MGMKQLTTVLALLSLAAFSSAQASPPEPRIFLTNHLGSVNQTLDANGEPEGAYRSYYPYGEMRTGEKTDGQVYGFNGNRTDCPISVS